MDKDVVAIAYQPLLSNLTGWQQAMLHQEHLLCTAILNAVSTLVMVVDRAGHIIRCNCAFEQTTGYKLNSVRDRPFWDLFLAQDDIKAFAAAFGQFQVDLLPIAGEYDWLDCEGNRRRIAWKFAPLFHADKTLKYAIATGEDISDRQQQKKERNRLKKALARQIQQTAFAREQEKAARSRAAELAKANDALKRSVAHLTTTDSLQSFLVAVLQESIEASGAVTAAVFVYNPTAHTLQNTAMVLHGEAIDIATDPRMEIWRSPVPAGTTDAWQIMSQRRRMFWVDNDNPPPEHWPISIPWHQQMRHKTIATMPLLIGEQALGFLGLCFATVEQPHESRLEQCWTLAQHAALALHMSDLVKQAQQTAVLQERNRMAQEIHDTLAQGFTGVVVQLEGAEEALIQAPQKAQAHIDRARKLARESLTEARRSVRALRPQALKGNALPDAIAHLALLQSANTSLEISFHLKGAPYALPPQIENNLLRIVQEALANVFKHARASHAEIELIYDSDELQLHVQDDGCGIDPNLTNIHSLQSSGGGSFGLAIMRERAESMGGSFTISGLEQGTTVSVIVPLVLYLDKSH